MQDQNVLQENTQRQLSSDDINRYSRQMLLPEIGVKGQRLIKNSSVLIVGIGGLGCPASMYIASSGVGKIGLIDFDVVEVNNLHRQVLHGEHTLSIPKVDSAKQFLQALNSTVNIKTFNEALTPDNALKIVSEFDVVLDCTDNAATRYLLNDACVLSQKCLISGSALRFEGQLTTYNYNDGPCYRCLFPKPPPREFVTNCSDGGVLGPVPGVIGTLQALEAVKVICGIGPSYVGKLLLFDGLQGKFTNIKLRGKQGNCAVCGTSPTITALLDDYAFLCGGGYDDKEKGITLLSDSDRISPLEYKGLSSTPHLLIDVRDEQEFEFCSLESTTLNLPYSDFEKGIRILEKHIKELEYDKSPDFPVIVVCRRGNDSQRAVHLLKEKFAGFQLSFKDIRGGLHGWTRSVDPSFPIY